MEMRLAVLSELVLGLIYGSLAGVISSIMMTLGAGQQDSMLKLLSLRHWMRARGLKTADKAKIIAAFNQKQEFAGFDQQVRAVVRPALQQHAPYTRRP